MKRTASAISSNGSDGGRSGALAGSDAKRAAVDVGGKPTSRARRAPDRYVDGGRAEGSRPSMAATVIPDAPTYYPTEEEYADPCAYIAKIRPEAEKYGICKVVPPAGWRLPPTTAERLVSPVMYGTRLQAVHKLLDGEAFPDGEAYTFADYKAMADTFKHGGFPQLVHPAIRAARAAAAAAAGGQSRPPRDTPTTSSTTSSSSSDIIVIEDDSSAPATGANSSSSSSGSGGGGITGDPSLATSASPHAAAMAPSVEALYWSMVEGDHHLEVHVEYGNDQDTRVVGSGFPRPGATSSGLSDPAASASGGASTAPSASCGGAGTSSSSGGCGGGGGGGGGACSTTPTPASGSTGGTHEYAGNTGTGISAAEMRYTGSAATAAAAASSASPSSSSSSSSSSAPPAPGGGGGGGGAVSLRNAVPCRFDDPSFYASTGWNLNNLPFLPPSVLRHVNEEINGVNVPWLYLGMLFASFAWHNEDHFLYSINYMHCGEGKTWYGVPGTHATEVERAMRAVVAARRADAAAEADEDGGGSGTGDDRDMIYHLTTVVPPSSLVAASDGRLPVYRLFQQAGEYVVTFPEAYHSGFSHGFNMAEACNFALPDWLPYGRRAVERYRAAASTRSCCFSHDQLLCNLARHVRSHTLAQVTVILQELTAIVVGGEEKERAALAADGVKAAIKLPNESDPRYECCQCRKICYLSAVVCKCALTAGGDRKRVACLRHHRHTCGCPLSSRILVYWYSVGDLQALLEGAAKDVLAMTAEEEAARGALATAGPGDAATTAAAATRGAGAAV